MSVVVTLLWIIILFKIQRTSVSVANTSRHQTALQQWERSEKNIAMTFFLTISVFYVSYAPVLYETLSRNQCAIKSKIS